MQSSLWGAATKKGSSAVRKTAILHDAPDIRTDVSAIYGHRYADPEIDAVCAAQPSAEDSPAAQMLRSDDGLESAAEADNTPSHRAASLVAPIAFDVDLGALLRKLDGMSKIDADEVYHSATNQHPYASHNHHFLGVNDNILLYAQNYTVTAPFSVRYVREGMVFMQYIKTGIYSRNTGGMITKSCDWSLQITNYPEVSIDFPSAQRQQIEAVGLLVRREFIVEVLGLDVHNIPKSKQSIFTSPDGARAVLQIPTPHDCMAILDDILDCRLTEPLRGSYLRAKAVELACMTVIHLNALGSRQNSPQKQSEQRLSRQLAAAAEISQRELHRPLRVADLAARVGLNRNQLTEGFAREYGLTPHQYLIKQRMERAQALIESRSMNLPEIATASGYTNYAAFSRAFSDYSGISPSRYRK